MRRVERVKEYFESERDSMTNKNLLELLAKLEWSGICSGPGTGFMNSGDDGTQHPACPLCGGIKDTPFARADFNAVFGHKPKCKLAKTIEELKRS